MKKWGFRFAALLLGLLPLLLFELAFRIANYPGQVPHGAILDLHLLEPLFVESQEGRLEIDPRRVGLFAPTSFPKGKGDRTFRIFVLGGSTVQGRPYGPQTAFSTWLQLNLEAADAETKWEVINCGGASYASYRVRKILEEVAGYDPDLIILYTGHNEFLEDRKYADVPAADSTLAKIATFASGFKTVQAMQDVIHSQRVGRPRNVMEAEVQTRLDRPSGLASFTRDVSWRDGVSRDFYANLEAMLVFAEARALPVIGCLPASNVRDTPPFKTALSPALGDAVRERFADHYAVARDPQRSDASRRAALRMALEIDPQHAGAAFLYGRLQLPHDTGDAKHWLQMAEDHDVCPLRMPSPMRHAARRLFATHAIPTIDVYGMVVKRSEDGIPGDESFVDHVHPTIEVHQAIAAALFAEMQRLGYVSPGPTYRTRRAERFAAQFARLDAVYFARAEQRLEALRRWASGAGPTGKPGAAATDGPAKGWTGSPVNHPSVPAEPQ